MSGPRPAPRARAPRSVGGARPRLVLAAATATMAMLVLDSSIVGTMLPSIGADLALSGGEQAWVVSSYLLAIALALPFAGRLVDGIGPGPAFALGSLGFVAGSAGIALSGTGLQIVLWRALAGLAAAVLMPATTALITGSFDAQARTRAIAIYTGFGQSFSLIGPAVGGLFAQFLGWRWGFLINVPAGACALGLLALSGMLGHRVARPPADAEDQGRLWNRSFTVSTVILAGLGFSMTIATVYGAAEVQRILGLAPLEAGLALLPLVLALLLATRWVARAEGVSARTFGIRGGLLMAAGLAVMSVGFALDGLVVICAGMVPVGAGIALLLAPMTAHALSRQPPHRHGTAAAISGTGRQLGAALGPLVFGAVAVGLGTPWGFACAAAVMVACAVAATALGPRTRRRA